VNVEFKNLRVRSFSLDHLQLWWEIEDTVLDPQDYDWYVERSESPAGPFDQITGPFSDRYYFIDHQVNLKHRYRQIFYRLRSVRRADIADISYSSPASLSAEPDLYVLEMRRLFEAVLREHNGRMVWIFPRKTFGQYCTACFDEVLKKKTRSRCETCFDTNYIGGYLDPIEAWVQIDPAPKADQPLGTGQTQQKNTTARLSAFPPCKPGDLLVEAENVRHEIVSVGSTQKGRSVVHQQLTLHEIVVGDIEFMLPINIDDLQNLEPSPVRNFINPTSVENIDRDVILGILGHET